MATLRTAALNLLRLAGYRSIPAGMQAVILDITALLAMAMRQPQTVAYCNFVSALVLVVARPQTTGGPIALVLVQLASTRLQALDGTGL